MDVDRQVHKIPVGRQTTYQYSQYKQKVCSTVAYLKHLKTHKKLYTLFLNHKQVSPQIRIKNQKTSIICLNDIKILKQQEHPAVELINNARL
jgi:exopolysaccharide biosynthesis protein